MTVKVALGQKGQEGEGPCNHGTSQLYIIVCMRVNFEDDFQISIMLICMFACTCCVCACDDSHGS